MVTKNLERCLLWFQLKHSEPTFFHSEYKASAVKHGQSTEHASNLEFGLYLVIVHTMQPSLPLNQTV